MWEKPVMQKILLEAVKLKEFFILTDNLQKGDWGYLNTRAMLQGDPQVNNTFYNPKTEEAIVID